MMYNKLKKIPKYAFKLFQKGNINDIFKILKNVEREHILIALAARLDNRPTCIKLKNEPGVCEINEYLSYRKEKVCDGIYRWNYHGQSVFCNHLQFTCLLQEFLPGRFSDIYQYDWSNKTVLDIGGFVGDTAFHFLNRGAKKVIIYEPLSANLKPLNYNLSNFKDKIEIQQKALTATDGPFTMYSSEPEGSAGFGMENGNYQIQCEGVSMKSILKQHPHIDVAKVDCEGGEKHLVDLSREEIRSIPYWMVETHSEEIYKNIEDKFLESGFSKVYEIVMTPKVSLLHFKLLTL